LGQEPEKLIKSKLRVQKHGEVFTPSWMVEKMLGVAGVKEACENLTSTFLEPAAGDGNFLKAILERKLKMVASKYANTMLQYENYSLLALSTIYGIELLEDNAQAAVMNLFQVFMEHYFEIATKFNSEPRHQVLSSARTIIAANIAQGNFLTREAPDGKPIVFSEWKVTNRLRPETQTIKVIRTEYTLDDIFSKTGNPVGSLAKAPKITEQLDLFDDFEAITDSEAEAPAMHYLLVKITDVYLEETEND